MRDLVGVGGQEDVELGFCRSVHLGPEWRGRAQRASPARLRRRKMGFTALRCLSARCEEEEAEGEGKTERGEGPRRAGPGP